MQLIIDVGNTKVKWAVFEKNTLLRKDDTLLEDFQDTVASAVIDFPISKAIISSVGRLSEKQMRAVQNRFPTVILNQHTEVPFVNEYSTPETLGVDRIALVSAFAKAYSGKNGLIIDAGTCITYDFINKKGVYLGGAISPGLRLRYESLNRLTANLPLLDIEPVEKMVGDSTASSMHSGVYLGTALEIDGVINEYKQQYKDLVVILTGGDAEILSKRLKNSIFAHSNFLLEGLNYILRFSND